MFKLLEKWLVVYILVFTAGFSVLGIGLSFAFKDFFYKQQQNIILNNAIRIENVLLDSYDGKNYFNNNFKTKFSLIDAYEDSSILVLDTNNIIQCVSQNVDNKFIGQKYTSAIPDTKSMKKTDNYKWITSDFSNTFDGAKYSIVYNIIISNKKIGTIILGCDRGSINQTLLQECIVILIFVLVINIVGFFFLRIFIDRALSPIREMSTVTAEIASGNFSKRIEIGNRMDEISILARNLNSMADSLEDQEQKRHEFISSISHDLRSPLTSIMGYLQAIIDGVIPEDKLPKYLNIIYSETERLNKMSNTILDLSKNKLNGAKLKYSNFNINELLELVASTLKVKAFDKNISIDFENTNTPVMVYADYEKIQRVIYNLLDNAIKFTNKNGKIILKAEELDQKAYISIIDNGIGVKEDEQARVFDRLYKADSSRGMDKTGSGLGLSIVKEFIKAHNEEIFVKSTLGKGSTFTFTLKLYNKNKK